MTRVSLRVELLLNILLPFGRHHIHCDPFAPRRGELDCDWHVVYAPCPLLQGGRFFAYIRPLNLQFSCFSRKEHKDDSSKICPTCQLSRGEDGYVYPC